ncbi:unnamed protein product [Amoebophrya sp. A120]|nr:unnamed protein product [Amoebophrya sp. A120]|eukprot:GSA120T00011608001.1
MATIGEHNNPYREGTNEQVLQQQGGLSMANNPPRHTTCSNCTNLTRALDQKIDEVALLEGRIGAGGVNSETTKVLRFRWNPTYQKILHDHVEEFVEAGKAREEVLAAAARPAVAVDLVHPVVEDDTKNKDHSPNRTSAPPGERQRTSGSGRPGRQVGSGDAPPARGEGLGREDASIDVAPGGIGNAGFKNSSSSSSAFSGGGMSTCKKRQRTEEDANANQPQETDHMGGRFAAAAASTMPGAGKGSQNGGTTSSLPGTAESARLRELENRVAQLEAEREADRQRTEKLKNALQVQTERYRVGVEEFLGWRLRMRSDNVWHISSSFAPNLGQLVIRSASSSSSGGSKAAASSSAVNSSATEVLSASSPAWLALMENSSGPMSVPHLLARAFATNASQDL